MQTERPLGAILERRWLPPRSNCVFYVIIMASCESADKPSLMKVRRFRPTGCLKEKGSEVRVHLKASMFAVLT